MELKIQRLPEIVINQIAAGEVVEGAASIVKELIENSLDANATRIVVEIVQGGQQLIRIEDDGCGMSRDDALLSLERHATSKLREVADLDSLLTMGFRGEALAAISSVAHFEMKTSNGVATRIVAEGGRAVLVEPCARNRGTTIEVRSLFYNVPARKKFQKSAGSDASGVRKVVETVALAHPEVSFTLISNEKTIVEVMAGDLQSRVKDILGEFAHRVDGKGVSGFVAAPHLAGPTRSGQYLFINRRPIFSPLIARAVKEGFGTRIAEHQYPQFVLYVEISPEMVDVNVHPQKKEVRFKEESALFRSVARAVENAFEKVTKEASISFTEPHFSALEMTFPEYRVEESPTFEMEVKDTPIAVFGNYLLLRGDGLIVVDLAAAHARVLYDNMTKETPAVQSLLVPLEFKVDCTEEEAEELNKAGIECRLLQRTLVVDALPEYLAGEHFALFFSKWREGKKMEKIVPSFTRAVRKQYSLEEATLLWRRVKEVYDPLGNRIWKSVTQEDLAHWVGR